MKGFLSWLFNRPKDQTSVVFVLPTVTAATWNDFHRDQLRAFFTSPTGQAFMARWMALEQANMSLRELRPDALPSGALLAVGFAQARHWALSLSSPVETLNQADSEETDHQGNQSTLERYSP